MKMKCVSWAKTSLSLLQKKNWNSVLILSFRGIKKETMLFLVYSKYFTKIKLIWTGSCWIVKHFQKHAINLRQTISHSCSSMTRSNAFVASCFHCSFSPCVLLNELYFVENTVWNLLIFRRETNSRKNFPEKSDLKNLKKKTFPTVKKWVRRMFKVYMNHEANCKQTKANVLLHSQFGNYALWTLHRSSNNSNNRAIFLIVCSTWVKWLDFAQSMQSWSSKRSIYFN